MKATTYTIPKKMSGTGYIHDIASQHYDRIITFAPGCGYAVVLADYYGGKGYTTHRTAKSAVKKSRSLDANDYSHAIIDTDGNTYGTDPDDRLYRLDSSGYYLR